MEDAELGAAHDEQPVVRPVTEPFDQRLHATDGSGRASRPIERARPTAIGCADDPLRRDLPFDRTPLAEHKEIIEELVDLGYTDVWSAEASGTDGFVPLAMAAAWAPSLRLGTRHRPVVHRGARRRSR